MTRRARVRIRSNMMRPRVGRDPSIEEGIGGESGGQPMGPTARLGSVGPPCASCLDCPVFPCHFTFAGFKVPATCRRDIGPPVAVSLWLSAGGSPPVAVTLLPLFRKPPAPFRPPSRTLSPSPRTLPAPFRSSRGVPLAKMEFAMFNLQNSLFENPFR